MVATTVLREKEKEKEAEAFIEPARGTSTLTVIMQGSKPSGLGPANTANPMAMAAAMKSPHIKQLIDQHEAQKHFLPGIRLVVASADNP